MTFEHLSACSRGLSRRFPNGNQPFQVMTRLLEECGELAQQVNHFEGQGVKLAKYGPTDREHLVKEIRQVLQCVIQVAQHYDVEAELCQSIDAYYQRLKDEGWIED